MTDQSESITADSRVIKCVDSFTSDIIMYSIIQRFGVSKNYHLKK